MRKLITSGRNSWFETQLSIQKDVFHVYVYCIYIYLCLCGRYAEWHSMGMPQLNLNCISTYTNRHIIAKNSPTKYLYPVLWLMYMSARFLHTILEKCTEYTYIYSIYCSNTHQVLYKHTHTDIRKGIYCNVA